jgi:hypothetical protein
MEDIKIITQHEQTHDASFISYEGELMIISLMSEHKMRIGDSIICQYQLKNLQSRVINIRGNDVYCFVPTLFDNIYGDRRLYHRASSSLSATLLTEEGEIHTKLLDLSNDGIGLWVASDQGIEENKKYVVVMHNEFLSIVPQIEVLHKMVLPDGVRLGCQIYFMKHEDHLQLRKYVMFKTLMDQTNA